MTLLMGESVQDSNGHAFMAVQNGVVFRLWVPPGWVMFVTTPSVMPGGDASGVRIRRQR